MLLSLLSIISCSTSLRMQNIGGSYKYKTNRAGFNYECEVILHRDSTFDFTEDGHGVFNKSSGKWILQGNGLVLTSFQKYGIDSVFETINSNIDLLKIEVFTRDGKCMEGATVILNGQGATRENISNVKKTNEKGEVFFEHQVVKMITISFLENYSFYPKDFQNNQFKIFIELKQPEYRYFNSEFMDLCGEYLLMKDDIRLKK